MHLPEFVLLVVATVAAIAAGLAVVASNFRVARTLFWIAALSFGSMGIVWALSTSGYSLATQMIVAAVCAGLAAAGLVWGLNEVRGRPNAEGATMANDPKPGVNITGGQNIINYGLAGIIPSSGA